jgi:uncharacterized protein YcnI
VLALLVTLLQVSVRPTTVVPAQHERYAVQVANPTDTAIVAVRVALPDAIALLGVDAPPGWTARVAPGSDTAARTVTWEGGSLARGEFREFALLGRLPGDARRETLVFPVVLRFADGTERRWGLGADAVAPAPTVAIRGGVGVSAGGAFVLAAGALGVGILGVALALRRAR